MINSYLPRLQTEIYKMYFGMLNIIDRTKTFYYSINVNLKSYSYNFDV